MKPDKRKALEKAGWTFGDAADFLEMSDEERQMLEIRMEAAQAVRRLRESLQLTQKELAEKLGTSQPRIVKIEQAASDVTLDQILRAYAAIGGKIDLHEVTEPYSDDEESGDLKVRLRLRASKRKRNSLRRKRSKR